MTITVYHVQLYKGVAWNNAVVFDGDELIGNADQFLQWAVDNYGYKDTRLNNVYTAYYCCQEFTINPISVVWFADLACSTQS